MSKFLAAAIQLSSSDDIAANIAQTGPLIDKAVAGGAKLVTLPENSFFMRREGAGAAPEVTMADHAGLTWAREQALRHGIWLLVGSIRAREGSEQLPFNRSVLVTPRGEIGATYDKLHLFDVTLPSGDHYKESAAALAGKAPTLARTPLAVIGMSVCYDLRFPQLYRALALAGAEVITIPSAFTRPTGSAHWHVLTRARAIENGCFVIAPAQCGAHPGGRETFGHSLIIDPWGKILAEATTDRPQVIMAEIATAQAAQVRRNIPVLEHHRALGNVATVDLSAY